MSYLHNKSEYYHFNCQIDSVNEGGLILALTVLYEISDNQNPGNDIETGSIKTDFGKQLYNVFGIGV